MKPFQLIRTNPALTGNVKLVINENYDLFLESFDSSRNLKQSRYKHYEITKDQYWKEVLTRFFDKTDSSDVFAVKQNDIYNSLTTYKNQYDDIYFSGCKIVDDKSYNETYEYSAPLHIKNELPSTFYIFAVDNMTSADFSDFKSNMNLVKTFDLTINSDLGIFLNNIVSDNTKPNHPLVMDTTYGLSYINGINLNTSGYINSYFDNNFTHENLPIFRMEEYVTSLYQKNNTIYPDIINMKFLFSDIPSTDTSIKDYNISRYAGLYANKILKDTVTPYKVLEVKKDISYKGSMKSFVDTSNKPSKPFDIVWNDETKYYVYVNKKYYRVVRNNDLFTIIDYKDDIPYNLFEKNSNVTIKNNILDIINFTFEDKSIYTIEILGKEYVISGNQIKSYDRIDADEFKVDITNNNITVSTINDDLVEFKIYLLDFLDVKDFDFDRVNTDQAKFEYDKTHEIVVNDEPKFYAKNHVSSNINVYTLVGSQYMRLPRVDTNNTPLYLQDNLGELNPITNKPYTQYELYTNDSDKNFMLYHDGVNFFDYNLKAVALKQEFIEENGYSYIVTDSNNVEYTIKFEDKKPIYQTANWGVDGKDIVSSSANILPEIPVTSPYSSASYIPASSEYVTSDESFEIQNNGLSKLYDKNQSVVKWGATGSLDIHNYPYRLNYSSDFPVYNSVIPFTNDISIYSRKDMCFDYFYRFKNNQNYSYAFSSLHLNVNSFDKFNYDFNNLFISSNINDKGKYNHYSYSAFTTKNKSSKSETIFRNLKIAVDNKYNEYKFSIIFANDTYSEDLKNGVNFIIDNTNKNIVMHLYINTSNTITLNNNVDISSCDIKYWYDDIYTKDPNNTDPNYIDTGFKVNGVYINIRPQDFALPNIISKLINNNYIAYDKDEKSVIDFTVDISYPDAIKLKNSFVTTIIDENIVENAVVNTYENMNINGTVTNLDLYKKDFVALSLEQKDTRNIWELDESDMTIYRHSFGYSPIFKTIELFDSSVKTNTIFDTDLYNFGITSELYLSKTNHHGSILKIEDTDNNKSMYPKVDEYGLFVTRKNIFVSNADKSTFIMNRKYTKDLTNTPAAGKAGYFNKSSIVVKDSPILSNENNLISQLDYTDYTENGDINNYEFIIPPGITDYNFTVTLLKHKKYSFRLNDTLDVYGMFVNNMDVSKITKSTSTYFNGYFIEYTYDTPETKEALTVDINYTLKLVNPNGGKINVYMASYGKNNESFIIPTGISDYNFNIKLRKYEKYSFKLNDTLDVYGMFINNVDSTKIEKSTSTTFNGYYIEYKYDETDKNNDLTIDLNYTLKLVNPTGGSLNVFLTSIGEPSTIDDIFYIGAENRLYVESDDVYLNKFDTDLLTSPYLFQTYDSNYNNLYSNAKNITEYIFPNDTYKAYMTTEPGRYGEEPYDISYTIPNTWDGNIYFTILNDKLGNNCGDNLREKIDLGAYNGKIGSSYDRATIYHFLEYGSQEYDEKNIDANDYRTFRVGYTTGLTYFYLLSGMNTYASKITDTYKTFVLSTKKYEDIPSQYLLGKSFVNNTLSTDYNYNNYSTEQYLLNSTNIIWDVFYNDKTLSFNIKTLSDISKTVDVEINLYQSDNVTKKTINEMTTELSNSLLNKYTVSSSLTNIDVVYTGANTIPRYTFTIKSIHPYYTENFVITLNTKTDFRLDNIINVVPTISYNEIAKKTELLENRITGRTNDITVEFFIKTDSFNKKFETIFYKGNKDADMSYFIGRDDISNRLLFRTVHENFFDIKEENIINNYLLNEKKYTTHDLYSSNFINDGKYHHVACVVDYLNRTKTIYIDGKVDNSVSDYLNNDIPELPMRLACFIANTPRFVGSDIIHNNIKNIYTLAYAILDIDNPSMDITTKKYAEYWKNCILGNTYFEYNDLNFMKSNWKITYDKAFKIFNDNFQSLNYSLKTDISQTFDLNIGNSPVSYMTDFVGCLDQIRVWNYARTSDDIYKNYRYDLANTYTAYDKSLVVNINFNTANTVTDTAVISKNVTSWFVSKNKKIFKTTNEYELNTFDNSESSFIKYDLINDTQQNTIIFDKDKLLLVNSEANIIGTRDEKANIPDIIDSTKINNYKSYYSNNTSSTNLSYVPSIVDSNLIYKL